MDVALLTLGEVPLAGFADVDAVSHRETFYQMFLLQQIRSGCSDFLFGIRREGDALLEIKGMGTVWF